MKEQSNSFQELNKKKFAPTGSLLAKNLEFVLTEIRKHFRKNATKQNLKNVFLFFHNGEDSKPPTKISKGFNLVAIDYSHEITGNFIYLDKLVD